MTVSLMFFSPTLIYLTFREYLLHLCCQGIERNQVCFRRTVSFVVEPTKADEHAVTLSFGTLF